MSTGVVPSTSDTLAARALASPPWAPDNRHRPAAGLIDAHHARVGALVAEVGRQQPYRGPDGEERHDA